MNIGAVFLSENAALRGLRQSQLPEKRSSKEDLDLQRASEEEQERLDGSENNHSQFFIFLYPYLSTKGYMCFMNMYCERKDI
uniref:Uncharacterized protein LOC105072487 isoform X2 n=1 Tax=Camelus bactrianus TaxID=9837 RepID=A0A9W3GBG4_CAMBA|nr:uncharacterized protein LOC105072487 isoform X2 [Camelus bactrianus]